MNVYDRIEEQLACVVCGYAQAGTTLFTRLLRSHPDIDGRFECGILAVDSPAKIHELPEIVKHHLRTHWRIDDHTLQRMGERQTFREAYEVLVTDSCVDPKPRLVFDKFPGYVNQLPALARKLTVPVFAVVRDPRAVFWSQFQRRSRRQGMPVAAGAKVGLDQGVIDLEAFAQNYTRTHENLQATIAEGAGDLQIFQLEQLVLDFDVQRSLIFQHLRLDVPETVFAPLSVLEAAKVREGLDASVIDAYRRHLTVELCERLIELTRPAASFHVHLTDARWNNMNG